MGDPLAQMIPDQHDTRGKTVQNFGLGDGNKFGTSSYFIKETNGGLGGFAQNLEFSTMPVTPMPSAMGNVPTTYPLRIRERSDGSNKALAEGDILFTQIGGFDKNGRGLNETDPIQNAASIWALNAYAEESHRWELAKAADPRQNSSSASVLYGKKRSHAYGTGNSNDVLDVVENFPKTANEFSQVWSFAGIVATDMESSKDKHRMTTMVGGGYARVSNLWGDVKTGEQVGFIVKEFNMEYPQFYNWKGVPVGDTPTAGDYLQLLPWSGPPVYCRRYMKPHASDLAYFSTKTVQMITYKQAANGRVLYDGPPELAMPKPVTCTYIAEGQYIPIGVVASRPGNNLPTEDDVKMGVRTEVGYRNIAKKGSFIELDINMSPLFC